MADSKSKSGVLITNPVNLFEKYGTYEINGVKTDCKISYLRGCIETVACLFNLELDGIYAALEADGLTARVSQQGYICESILFKGIWVSPKHIKHI